MNNDDKLKIILKNVIDRCTGEVFWKIELNGSVCDIRKEGEKYIIESPNNGYRIDVDTIENVEFNDDVFYATFKAGHWDELGVNIMKDMSPHDIETELLKYNHGKWNSVSIAQQLAEEDPTHWMMQYEVFDI